MEVALNTYLLQSGTRGPDVEVRIRLSSPPPALIMISGFRDIDLSIIPMVISAVT